ncbi:hypothetical protein OG478_18775 [Streptomyces phaeochromogenes]|uniref:hypothetical protein n=1 Tax=Streptomyces phaeochromogenes TaxID=1923 RepID=UPI003867B08C|nr:hypothetical protein OG478_18775 [Streptomyces phaeochromogenes]
MSSNLLDEAVISVQSTVDDDIIPIDAPELLNYISAEIDGISVSRHPLGFIHAELSPLLDLHEGQRVRLHVWNEFIPDGDNLGLVHDHAWNLTSAVLLGELADVALEAIPDDAGSHQGTRVKYGPVNTFTLARRYNIRELGRRHVKAGQVYRIPSRRIHRTEVTALPLVTLLFTQDDPPGSPGPIIFSPFPSTGGGTGVREKLSSAEATSLLKQAADSVTKSEQR